MKYFLPSCLLLAFTFQVYAADNAEVLRAYIIEQCKSQGKLTLPVRVNGTTATSTTVYAADAKGIDVDASGGRMTIPWKLIDDDALLQMYDPLWPKTPAPVHAAYLRLTIKRGLGSGNVFKKMLQSLWEKDASLAREIEALVPGAAIAGASKDAATPAMVIPANAVSDKEAYARAASDSDLQWIERQLGPDYDSVHKGGNESLPTLPATPTKNSGKIGPNGRGFTYQLGTAVPDAGLYWTTQGQALYVPEKPADAGVDRVDFASFGHHCLKLNPELAWWGGAHPEPGVQQSSWLAAAGGKLGQPIAIARSYCAFSANGFMLFRSGLLAAAAVNNVSTYPYFMFPKTKVPTALSLTSKNEFALVTVWDTQQGKGQLAVLALGCQDKGRVVFGLPSWGVIDQIKLLGYVDLPVALPTDVSATSCGGWSAPVKSTEYKLEDPKDRRARFESDEIARSGFAVVLSRCENKAVFVDLQPLIAGVREMCFTTQANADKARAASLAPNQWPYAFEVDARYRPRILGTVDVASPVSVRVSPWRNLENHRAHAVIGTLEGELQVFDCAALANEGSHSFADVKALPPAHVGKNPCAIAVQRYADPYRKATQGSGFEGTHSGNDVFLVCCRGDREIDWVELTPRGAEVYRRLKDSRMLDPVDVQQTRVNSDDAAYIVTVCDFVHRKLLNYRVGDAHIDHKAIPITDGKSEVEFTGALEFPGRVFGMSADNVP